MPADLRVPRVVLLRYGIGQTGAQMFRDVPAVLLPLFMTTMLGVPPWMAGLAVLIPKAWVIVCDPLVGAWSDRLKPKMGRSPFLILGALGSSLGFLMLFRLGALSAPWQSAALISLIYLISSTAFSAFSVPYLAIASELSPEPHERTRILAYRMFFTIVGLVLGVGFAQPLLIHFGGGASAWRLVTALLALACLISMSVSAVGFRGRGPAEIEPPHNLLKQLGGAFQNAPFRILLITFFILSIGQACSYTVLGFVYLYVFNDVSVIPVFILTMSGATVLSQPAWLALSRRYGKERCFVGASIFFILVTLTWVGLRPGAGALVHLPVLGGVSVQYLLVLARGALIGFSNSGFILLAFSMLTDTIDFERRVSSAAQEGVYSGLFSAADKLAFALGPMIAGIVLSIVGFKSSTHGFVPQSPQAAFGVLMIYSVVPASIQIASLLVFAGYRRRLMAGGPEAPALASS